MKPRILALLAVVIGSGLVLVAISLLNRAIVQPAFERLEQRQALEDSSRARAAIQRELEQLDTQLGDWAEWDDAYHFAVNADPAFIDSNLGNWATLERSSHLNLCLIVDNKEQVLYSQGYDSALGGAVKPAAFMGEHPPVLALFRPVLDYGWTRTGILLTEHGLLLLAARPILTTQGMGPTHGMLVFGRFLDEPLVHKLAEHTRVAFTLFTAGDPRLSSEEQGFLQTFKPGVPQLQVAPLKIGFVYETLADLADQPVALLRTPIRQDISAVAHSTSRALSGILGLAALALLLGVAWFFTQTKYPVTTDVTAWGTAGLVLTIGLTLTYGLFEESRRRNQEALAREFHAAAAEQAEQIIYRFQDNLEELNGLRRLFEVTPVSRQQFRDFVTPLLERPGFQALEWLPRVPREQRARYEKAAQQDGLAGFRFTEPGSDGRLTTAADRTEYFPVYYLEPYTGNARALGFAPGPDHPARGIALKQARDTGQLIATARYILVQEPAPGARFSVLIFAPVYEGPRLVLPVEERRRRLQGFVLGVVRISDVVERVLKLTENSDLVLRLLDLSAQDDQRDLYHHPPSLAFQQAVTTQLRFQREFPLGGRVWQIEVGPSADFVARFSNQMYWWIPLTGGLITLLASLYLFALVSQRHRAETLVTVRTAELRESEERYRLLFERSNDAIFVIAKGSGRCLTANRAAERLTGKSLSEITTFTPADLAPVVGSAPSHQLADTTETIQLGEVDYRHPDGTIRTALFSIVPVSEHIAFGLAHDITESKATERHIQQLAYYDPLTNLPNRTLLAERAELALNLANRHQAPAAVLFLDLDRFKEVNDALGHAEGDLLLMQAAARLQAATRAADTVCRLGGDEFVVLLPDSGRDEVLQVTDRLLELFRQPFDLAGHKLGVTVSVGIALYPHDGQNFADLLQNADTALYRAKQDGRNTRMFYDRQMNAATFARLMLEAELRTAIAAGQLRAYFQPKVNLSDGALIGAEALVRWLHPDRGLIPPGQFIPVAEASDLIVELGDWMLAAVCRQLADWRESGLPVLTVAVNLAARHFRTPGLASHIHELLVAHGLTPHVLELEITESTLLETGTQTEETLSAFEQLGVGLSIDDFGTGYSSLGYLKRLPLTALKIDQSFVRDLVSDPDDRMIAATIVALGHGLQLTVVAEGVETDEQRAILLEQGCDFAQGYLFGRPMPAEEFTQWLIHYRSNPQDRAKLIKGSN